MALSYVNRMIAMIAPWVVEATPSPPPPIAGPYRCGRLSTAQRRRVAADIDGVARQRSIVRRRSNDRDRPRPADASKNAWRLTNFSARARVARSHCDRCKNPSRLARCRRNHRAQQRPRCRRQTQNSSAQRFAKQAGLDRWQLTSNQVRRASEDWNLAVTSRATNQRAPS